ncbi:hypothetical protein SEA_VALENTINIPUFF_96 [Microbacterium phage ValentiniPuff]|uniref:Uncharacterized protein n=1 Tax=Microbacterium phage ValentiniPuff TaxID=2315705 RepID=A0A386KQ80_9CAUD|nr:hypothetical protein SEA_VALENTINIPUFF_96 [Microbacterium phage ValentiniPuff]
MDWSKFWAVVIVVLSLVLLFALLIGINWLRAGGDWGCVFSQDPSLCVAVKGR